MIVGVDKTGNRKKHEHLEGEIDKLIQTGSLSSMECLWIYLSFLFSVLREVHLKVNFKVSAKCNLFLFVLSVWVTKSVFIVAKFVDLEII